MVNDGNLQKVQIDHRNPPQSAFYNLLVNYMKKKKEYVGWPTALEPSDAVRNALESSRLLHALLQEDHAGYQGQEQQAEWTTELFETEAQDHNTKLEDSQQEDAWDTTDTTDPDQKANNDTEIEDSQEFPSENAAEIEDSNETPSELKTDN